MDDIPERYKNELKAGYSPEEIAEWRANRRKRHPSNQHREVTTAVIAPASKEKPAKKKRTPSKRVCRFFKQGKCQKGDLCTFSHDVQVNKKPTKRNTVKRIRLAPPTLLDKLLKREQEKEEEVLLQCIEYLVEKKGE